MQKKKDNWKPIRIVEIHYGKSHLGCHKKKTDTNDHQKLITQMPPHISEALLFSGSIPVSQGLESLV